MATYKEAGVDIDFGDKCSKIAYQTAKNTFLGRKGLWGEPVVEEGGFTGLLDMGDFLITQNDDGIGTKMIIGERSEKLDTLGFDLVAMVADDAVCVGAEPVSISNTLDVNQLNEEKVKALMSGLETACLENKIIIPGGEIAELGDMCNNYVWNATCLGIVEKDKIISGKDIQAGDKIIGLRSAGLRSNGFSLVRHILKQKLGDNWYFEKYDPEMTWGQITLTPSKIYTGAVMEMHGRFKEEKKVNLKGITHVTGGGIKNNLKRTLKKSGLGAKLDNLPDPPELIKRLMEMGEVGIDEAYRTWNMGVGMILISNDVDKIEEICKKHEIDTQIIGEVAEGGVLMPA
ncbi:phosphoribosylformylglycinamidine cyclo-ligase [Candidatus Peregrinibacteria bacterium]|nr:phosphoribosylformylglycinamidine cyclo-ligase [Candidatus Peregrinibacteria bacterium]